MTETVAEPAAVETGLAEPHHDGSEAYVLQRPAEPGDVAVVRLRVPRSAGVDAVALRSVRDGEASAVRAEVDAETGTETWWRASFRVAGRSAHYRWLLQGRSEYAWLNGTGLVRREVPDADDFVLALDPGGPEWHLGSVVYEIFPDRFASSGLDVEPPSWAVPRAWGERPTGRGPVTSREWFGGDLRGIEQRLDHVSDLGASALYLTPIFPARSTHRYDATSFDRIDPLLGGDEALASLVAAAHGRGIRVVGDLTLNHCGAGHDWFAAARNGRAVPERDFFTFGERFPHGYAAWLGVPSLPKLNWASPELRARMLAVERRWLDAGLDGWRIDVANMVGRLGPVDLNADVARAVRDALPPDALLVAEHGHDFRLDLGGDGWHGVMNYSGFLRPVWWWLRHDGFAEDPFVAAPAPKLDGPEAVATMRAFRAGVPWPQVLHSWTLVDSHDVARFRTVAGSRDRHLVALGLQMTSPGVPMVFAGDELGLEGRWGEDGRRTMPWDRPETWDTVLLEEHRRLIAVRRSSDALARGGIRYAHISADAIAYLRETPGERLLCLASRADHPAVRLPLDLLGATELEPLHGGEASREGAHVSLPPEGPAFHVWRLIDG
jgi:alpha-glucosidase